MLAYTEFYVVGAQQGREQAERMLRDPDDVPNACALYKSVAAPKGINEGGVGHE